VSKLTGKVAVVTGASKGIGASIAEHLADAGASVVVNYASSKTSAEAVVERIAARGGKAIAVQGDVSNPADIVRLFAETKKAYGKLDILVNNAGIYEFLPLEAITPEHFHKQFDLNVLGLLLTTQEAVKLIGADGGSIVNVSSIVGPMPVPMASEKIRVNSINPGMVETEGLHAAGFAESDFRKHTEATTPLGRIAQPRDIATAAVFFASDDAGWVTGQTLVLAGGARQ
jgi:3-oxoacyl-[acyl-carrier protein] reductase